MTTISYQLFTLIENTTLFSYQSADTLVTSEITNFPFLSWPNGNPCSLGNLYMLSLLRQRGRGELHGLSRKGSKGGTMGEYAFKISHLIKFCYMVRKDFKELNDNDFTNFISSLRNEQSPTNPLLKKRNENTVVAIGKICLSFLTYVGHFYNEISFVAPNGTIRATERFHRIRKDSRKSSSITYLHHHSFTNGFRQRRRNPISTENIQRLKSVVDISSNSAFVRERRRCLISLLEQTGARRTEVAMVRTEDILRAYHMPEPLLRMKTLKQGDKSERFIPTTKMLLHDLKKHIEFNRKNVMKSSPSHVLDQGYFFISLTTGRAMSSATVSNEIALLRKLANIDEPVCPHMFRHAFITNLFALIMLRHKMNNEDDFQRALLDSEAFKAEVMQWTGHLDSESLDRYITLARSSLSGYSETVSSIHAIKVLHAFREREDDLIQLLIAGMPAKTFKAEILQLRQLCDQDLNIASQRKTLLS